MVFINGQKFACESCIKGHRSSSCQHSERPLFEIKKKGRPVSQCEKCRELRKTKRMHNKCNCVPGVCTPASSGDTDVGVSATAGASSSTKPGRFKPIAPSLPNGIKDLINPDGTLKFFLPDTRGPAHESSCDCLSPCSCHQTTLGHVTRSLISAPSAPLAVSGNGLATLAQAAAYCCGQETNPVPPVSNDMRSTVPSISAFPVVEQMKRPLRLSGCCSKRPAEALQSPSIKHHKPSPPSSPHAYLTPSQAQGLDLPPILSSRAATSAASMRGTLVPEFPNIPPLSAIMSIAGSGCTCGVECVCPGCVEHRGSQHASCAHEDCPDSCGTCIDHMSGVELPTASGSRSAPDSNASFIDAFFARAAALPPPPSTRSVSLDATNMTTYPPSLFGRAQHHDRGAAFGLVALPPLQCGCSGGCGCPAGRCECGDGCDGCCDEGDADRMVVTPTTRIRTGSTSSFAVGMCA